MRYRPGALDHDEREVIERDIREGLRLIAVTLDDIASALERLRQLRQEHAPALPKHGLLVHEGPNGRPEVLR